MLTYWRRRNIRLSGNAITVGCKTTLYHAFRYEVSRAYGGRRYYTYKIRVDTSEAVTNNTLIYIDMQETNAKKIKFAVNEHFGFKDNKKIKVVSHDKANNGRLGFALCA